MAGSDRRISEKVITTVAEVLDEDPIDLPPLERTISSDALDTLFHPNERLPGAYTIFPYCDLWVTVHSNGTVNVFDNFVGTSAADRFPEPTATSVRDDRLAILFANGNTYTFYRDDLDELQEIVDAADDYEQAWEAAIEYAHASSPSEPI